MSEKRWHRYRSAITGRFVNLASYVRWPKNTVKETVEKKEEK